MRRISSVVSNVIHGTKLARAHALESVHERHEKDVALVRARLHVECLLHGMIRACAIIARPPSAACRELR